MSNKTGDIGKSQSSKPLKKKSFRHLYALFFVPVAIALSLVYVPNFWVTVFVIVDFLTPWVLFDSKMYDIYHNFLISRLSEKPELPIPTILPQDATPELIMKLSKAYTFPIIIKGLLENSTALSAWNNRTWWVENYGPEEVLCGTLSNVVEDCNIKAFFDELDAGKPFYISGASEIFERNPALHDMIDSEQIRSIEPGVRTATQVFMGFPDMGSDIHCAVGINIFRQIVGRKKWWFIPPSQTAFLKPSLNVRGISSHTRTLVGKEGGEPSPWMTKLERYTAVLDPGDVLFNPPWFWHGILNLGESKTDLVIGSPSRYGKGYTNSAAIKSNPAFTFMAFATILYRYGPAAFKPGFKMNLQQDIANNRRQREGKQLVDVFDEDA